MNSSGIDLAFPHARVVRTEACMVKGWKAPKIIMEKGGIVKIKFVCATSTLLVGT